MRWAMSAGSMSRSIRFSAATQSCSRPGWHPSAASRAVRRYARRRIATVPRSPPFAPTQADVVFDLVAHLFLQLGGLLQFAILDRRFELATGPGCLAIPDRGVGSVVAGGRAVCRVGRRNGFADRWRGPATPVVPVLPSADAVASNRYRALRWVAGARFRLVPAFRVSVRCEYGLRRRRRSCSSMS